MLAPGKHTDPGIRPRWWDFAQEQPRLEPLATTKGATQALLEEVWRLPRGESDFVTVIVPEQFKRPSLAVGGAAESFRLKLRLLSEPGVVVTDVPAVTRPTRRATRPSGSPSGCCSRTSTPGSLRAPTTRESLGIEDTRAVSFAFDGEEAARFRERVQRAGLRCRST